MSSFEFTDEYGQRLTITPVAPEQPDDAPALWFKTTDGGWGGTSVKVPLDKLEEAIAGQRDMARQAGGLPAPQPLTVHIEMGNEDVLRATLRDLVRRGPEGAGA